MKEQMLPVRVPGRSLSPALPLVVALAFAVAAPAANDHFDGTWDTVLSCENAAGALGYSFKFPSMVRNGALHGERGTKSKPGWLQLDGKILADGSAKIYADGLVGAAEAAVGHRPPGTQYGYHIEAKFSDDSGTGKRVEGRPCTVEFTKSAEFTKSEKHAGN